MGVKDKYYRDIFSLKSMPWMSTSSGPDYEGYLEEIGIEKYIVAPTFMVEFCKALGIKRRCYYRWINNGAIRFINELYRDMQQAADEQEKKDIVRGALKTLTRGIRFQVEEAYIRGYKPEHYEPNGEHNSLCIKDGNDAYIVLYTIHRQVCMYLEVQEQHLQYMPADDVMTIDDAYQYFCNHLCRKHVVRVADAEAPPAAVDPKPVLVPCKGDLRPPPKGVLTYDEMIKNPEKFAWLEQELFASNLIDHQHTFQNKRGAQTTLAMIIAHLVGLGYFNDKVIPGLRPIRLIDVIHFAEHRYQVSLYRLVRNAVADPRGLDRFVKMHRWLELLPGRK